MCGTMTDDGKPQSDNILLSKSVSGLPTNASCFLFVSSDASYHGVRVSEALFDSLVESPTYKKGFLEDLDSISSGLSSLR